MLTFEISDRAVIATCAMIAVVLICRTAIAIAKIARTGGKQ